MLQQIPTTISKNHWILMRLAVMFVCFFSFSFLISVDFLRDKAMNHECHGRKTTNTCFYVTWRQTCHYAALYLCQQLPNCNVVQFFGNEKELLSDELTHHGKIKMIFLCRIHAQAIGKVIAEFLSNCQYM